MAEVMHSGTEDHQSRPQGTPGAESEKIDLLEDHLGTLVGDGVRHVLSVPVGFVADHVEVLYDIDIKAREHAGAWLRGTADAA